MICLFCFLPLSVVTHTHLLLQFNTQETVIIKTPVVSKELGATITNMLAADKDDIDDEVIFVEERFMDVNDNGNESIDFGKDESEGKNQARQANENPANVAKVINLDGDEQKVKLDLCMRHMTWLFLHNIVLQLCCDLSHHRYLSEEMTSLEVTVESVMD